MLDVSAAIELYKGDLPTPEMIEQEILRWKMNWSSVPENERPQTCATAIKSCSSIAFPNIYTLLKIACTLPVTSVNVNASSHLQMSVRLENYMRHCMTERHRRETYCISSITYPL